MKIVRASLRRQAGSTNAGQISGSPASSGPPLRRIIERSLNIWGDGRMIIFRLGGSTESEAFEYAKQSPAVNLKIGEASSSMMFLQTARHSSQMRASGRSPDEGSNLMTSGPLRQNEHPGGFNEQ
jgi:hypothetical protein